MSKEYFEALHRESEDATEQSDEEGSSSKDEDPPPDEAPLDLVPAELPKEAWKYHKQKKHDKKTKEISLVAGEVMGYQSDGKPLWSTHLCSSQIDGLKTYMNEARDVVDRDCISHAFSPGASEYAMADCFRSVAWLKPGVSCPATKSDNIAVVYEVLASGEAISNPFRNRTPFRKDHFDRHTRAALHCSLPGSGSRVQAIDWKTIFVIFDAGESGNLSQMLSAFAKDSKAPKFAHSAKNTKWVYEQKSVVARAQRFQGIANLFESEGCHIVSQRAPSLPVIGRRAFPGDNRSGAISAIVLRVFYRVGVWKETPSTAKQNVWREKHVGFGERELHASWADVRCV